MTTITLKGRPAPVAETKKPAPVPVAPPKNYAVETTAELRERIKTSPLFAEAVVALHFIETLRYPNGHKTPDGQDYHAQIDVRGAIDLYGIILAAKGRQP
jgi:hypothetical protein